MGPLYLGEECTPIVKGKKRTFTRGKEKTLQTVSSSRKPGLGHKTIGSGSLSWEKEREGTEKRKKAPALFVRKEGGNWVKPT